MLEGACFSLTKIGMNKPKDRLLRLFGIPIIAIIFTYIFNAEYFAAGIFPVRGYIVSNVHVIVLWELNRFIFIKLRGIYKQPTETKKRLIVQFFLVVLATVSATAVMEYSFTLVKIEYECNVGTIYEAALINLIPTIFVVSIYESVYFFTEWKNNLHRSEALAKESIKSQLDVLKSQLDPHFLFNSLNTLASLIEDNNSPALTYLEQLSDVYRYVLLNKDKETITLEEEMKFVASYIYLNKTRFRDNLIIDINIDAASYSKSIAPLSLQILIENALKHNIISKEQPLHISLFAKDGAFILVENELQEKNIVEKSTKTGLNNIINRYALLTKERVHIIQNEAKFSVQLPLLNPA